MAASGSLAQSTTTSDSYTETASVAGAISETAAAADNYTDTLAAAAALSETTATLESYTEIRATSASIAESAATSDTYTETMASLGELTESIATSEIYSAGITFILNVTFQCPVDWAALTQSDVIASTAWVTDVTTNVVIPLEFLGTTHTATTDATFALEINRSVSSGMTAPIELYRTIRNQGNSLEPYAFPAQLPPVTPSSTRGTQGNSLEPFRSPPSRQLP